MHSRRHCNRVPRPDHCYAHAYAASLSALKFLLSLTLRISGSLESSTVALLTEAIDSSFPFVAMCAL
jgi:hypothetical protein